MATLQELENALVKADAAGNTEDAMAFASEIRRMRSQPSQEMGSMQFAQADTSALAMNTPRVPVPTRAYHPHAQGSDIPPKERSLPLQLARQGGLTGRYGLEGVGQAMEFLTEPIRTTINPLLGAVGLPKASMSAGQLATSLADVIGLPQPETKTERIVGDATRSMTGAAGGVGAARQLAGKATGIFGDAMNAMAAGPSWQLAGGAAGGAGGGAAREDGASDLGQMGASVAAGIGAGSAVNVLANTGKRLASMVPSIGQKSVDQSIQISLKNSGVNWSEIPDQVRQALRADVKNALNVNGDIDDVALRRLLDFRLTGATPTRGSLTLDPVQVTREKNLASSGANSTDEGLQGLARIQNDNNNVLIQGLNRLGAGSAEDAYSAGNRALGALERGIDAETANINQLYSAARDSSGRSIPLDRSAFTQRANDLLDEAMVGGSLPGDVRNRLNRIATGEVPFDVNYAEQLKTRIGNIQRSANDGQTRYALGLVRQALDETPLVNIQQARSAPISNPSNLPIVKNPSAVDFVQPNIGEEALSAFNQARAANRSLMQRIEGNPALKALYEGKASPDDFVKTYVISQAAKADDVANLSTQLKADPEAVSAVRGAIADHLKAAAIGKGTADEVGKFSASNFRKELNSIGDRKLLAFFTKEEVAQLRSISRVANYTSAQPVGSAVNNSNSGTFLEARGFDLLNRFASKVPILGIGPTVQANIQSSRQRAAQNIGPALLGKSKQAPSNLKPAIAFGGLFALPQAANGGDERR